MIRYIFLILLYITICPGLKAEESLSVKGAMSALQKIDSDGKYAEQLGVAGLNVLPVGVKKNINNMAFTMAVSKVTYHTEYAEMEVYARIDIPDKSSLFFGARKIKFSYKGDFVGGATLALLEDVNIPFNNNFNLLLKGGFDEKNGSMDSKTFITVSCKGLEELSLDAEVFLPKSVFEVDQNGNKTDKRVSASFRTVVTDWNDVIAEISLPDFGVRNLDDYIFSCHNAIFDFSETRNSQNVSFPQGYDQYLISGCESLWQGVYISELRVYLPSSFRNKNTSESDNILPLSNRVSFFTRDMLLDENGVSGQFYAYYPILDIGDGSASGWAFSINRFFLELEANSLKKASFEGYVGLPVGGGSSDTNNGDKGSQLQYEAFMDAENNYFLTVTPVEDLAFDVFYAQASITSDSWIRMEIRDCKFYPEAMLHGTLGIMEDKMAGTDIMKFKGIKFQSLHLQTVSPYITAQYFGYEGKIGVANFPVSLENIALRATEREVGLSLGINVEVGKIVNGGTNVRFIGQINNSDGHQKWKFKTVELDKINLDATISNVVHLNGELQIYRDDPLYGDAFVGDVGLKIEKLELEVKSRAMFGHKDFSYWYVDGSVKLPGNGVGTGFINLQGFSGGISYNVKRTSEENGFSDSGCSYIPDKQYGFGFKSGVLFNAFEDRLVNGEASFEILFNKNNGVNYMGFFGAAQFLGKIPGVDNVEKFVSENLKNAVDLQNNTSDGGNTLNKISNSSGYSATSTDVSKIYKPGKIKHGGQGFTASTSLEFDFQNNSFHSTFDMYANFLNVVRGVGDNNRAGWAVLHIDRDSWYMHAGTPTNQIGLKVGIGSLLNISTKSYLMIGDNIPGSPAPPVEVTSILKEDPVNLDYMKDLNLINSYKGFAFGSSLSIDTGDMTFLCLYARFMAGMGCDVMLKDYGNASCKGRSGSIGFDGWYGNGQMYAYMQGELGVKVKLWFLKAKFPIIQGSTATLLQAQLPNPFWMRGAMAVNYSLLRGAVKGNMKFKFTLGEKCDLVEAGSSPIENEMISDITPKSYADVFEIPQVAFNMSVGEMFVAETDNGKSTLRINMSDFSLYDSDGLKIDGEIRWNSNKDRADFYSYEVLPSNSEITLKVAVDFEEYKNGKWNVVYTGGLKSQEKRELVFTTNDAPDNIPLRNVTMAYPVVDQRNFFVSESNRGVIRLERGQSYLFNDPDLRYCADFLTEDGAVVSSNLIYDVPTRTISYEIPNLGTNTLYEMSISARSADAANSDSGSTEMSYRQIGDDENEIEVMDNKTSLISRSDIGKSLLSYAFRSSRYETFSERINSIQKKNISYRKISSVLLALGYSLKDAEHFDLVELSGTNYTGGKPLVEIAADGEDDYFKKDINPYIYKYVNKDGIGISGRDVNEYGIPPFKAVVLLQEYLRRIQNDDSKYLDSAFPFEYNLQYHYYYDMCDIRSQIVGKYLNTSVLGDYNDIVNYNFRFIRDGDYGVKLKYRHPDGEIISEASFFFSNRLFTNE